MLSSSAYQIERGLMNESHLTMDDHRNHVDPNGKYYLRYQRLDSQGYDVNGNYWGAYRNPKGVYERLYWYGQDGSRGNWVRAESREDAKRAIRELMPNIVFYR